MKKDRKLAVIALGKRNSGKSNTWYEIFGRTIRTGLKRLEFDKYEFGVYVKNSSFEESGEEVDSHVFVRNSSFEETGEEADDFFDTEDLPLVVFCSVQYIEKGIRTIQWFKDQGYELYIQWLNPGYYYDQEYSDFLNFEGKFKGSNSVFVKLSGKEKMDRAKEIKEYVF